MFSFGILLGIIVGYMALLFLIAHQVEQRRKSGRKTVERPWIYGLSLAVYCTAWTFYGSVGYAVEHGFLFIAIHLGTTLGAFCWNSVLRRMVRIKSAFRITSLADFLSARYANSSGLAIIAAVMTSIGIIPYIGLQLRAILASATLLTGGGEAWWSGSLPPVIFVLLSAFTILFGLRRLDPTERHPGIVVALAVECVLKLTAFLAVGLLVTSWFPGGLTGLLQGLETQRSLQTAVEAERSAGGVATWIAYLLLGASTSLLLPRQFQVAVVENSDERHIRTAQWLFPLYLLAINFFVLPIAAAGLLQGIPASVADTYLIRLPILLGHPLLTLFVFLGGFSAAAGMVAVETMAIASLTSNHVILPMIAPFPALHGLRRYLLPIRWALAMLIILTGYGYARFFGSAWELIRVGLPSFVAMAQFLPVLLGGLYWRRANRAGAYLGLTAGFLLWTYTLAVPVFSHFGLIPPAWVAEGPAGIAWFRPEALFGLTGLDPITHSTFWSLIFNLCFFIGGSLFFEPSQREEVQATQFVDILGVRPRARNSPGLQPIMPSAEVRQRVRSLLLQYFNPELAEEKLKRIFEDAGIPSDRELSALDLSEVQGELERTLAGSIGVATAHDAVKSVGLLAPERERELSAFYASMLAELRLPPSQLFRRIDDWRERQEEMERLLAQERQAHAMAAEALRLRDEFISVASHELKTPLTPLKLQIGALKKMTARREISPDVAEKLLAHSDRQLNRLARLIESLLDVSRLSLGRFNLACDEVDFSELVQHLIEQFQLEYGEDATCFEVDIEPGIVGTFDRLRVEQLAINLISNSIKFGCRKPIEVRLKRQGSSAVLTVRDQGIGISPEDQGKIFNRFEQAVSAPHYGGLGLGLYISRQIVEAHAGRIWVESVPNQGALFTVELPLSATH